MKDFNKGEGALLDFCELKESKLPDWLESQAVMTSKGIEKAFFNQLDTPENSVNTSDTSVEENSSVTQSEMDVQLISVDITSDNTMAEEEFTEEKTDENTLADREVLVSEDKSDQMKKDIQQISMDITSDNTMAEEEFTEEKTDENNLADRDSLASGDKNNQMEKDIQPIYMDLTSDNTLAEEECTEEKTDENTLPDREALVSEDKSDQMEKDIPPIYMDLTSDNTLTEEECTEEKTDENTLPDREALVSEDKSDQMEKDIQPIYMDLTSDNTLTEEECTEEKTDENTLPDREALVSEDKSDQMEKDIQPIYMDLTSDNTLVEEECTEEKTDENTLPDREALVSEDKSDQMEKDIQPIYMDLTSDNTLAGEECTEEKTDENTLPDREALVSEDKSDQMEKDIQPIYMDLTSDNTRAEEELTAEEEFTEDKTDENTLPDREALVSEDKSDQMEKDTPGHSQTIRNNKTEEKVNKELSVIGKENSDGQRKDIEINQNLKESLKVDERDITANSTDIYQNVLKNEIEVEAMKNKVKEDVVEEKEDAVEEEENAVEEGRNELVEKENEINDRKIVNLNEEGSDDHNKKDILKYVDSQADQQDFEMDEYVNANLTNIDPEEMPDLCTHQKEVKHNEIAEKQHEDHPLNESEKHGNSNNEKISNNMNSKDTESQVDVQVVNLAESDDGDEEGNVEIVNIPEVETDELILPDLAEESNTLDSNVDNGAKFVEEEELREIEEPTDDSELVAVEPTTNSKQNEKIESDDPLNVEAATKCQQNSIVAAVGDDDDDDVQVIEIRNSPICVDSEDNLDVLPSHEKTKAVTKDVIKDTKVDVAYKSRNEGDSQVKPTRKLRKTRTTPNLRKRDQSCLQQNCVIDTIDLVDSEDEQEPVNRKTAKRLPIKRCLLPNKKQGKRKSLPSRSEVPPKCILPKPPVHPVISTPQSNFLNAVNLQPANPGNPPAFSAQIFNRSVIIPNAFYGNPPEMREEPKAAKASKTTQQSSPLGQTVPGPSARTAAETREQIYRRWLDNFLVHFASPLQIASHTCFVLLQRVLKYKFLQKIKEARTNLNTLAQHQQAHTIASGVDIQLMLDLRHVFYKSDAQLSEVGIRFCEFASNYVDGKLVPLTTDFKTGRVTSRTRCDDDLLLEATVRNRQSNGLWKTLTQPNGGSKKRQNPDLDEYTPGRNISITAQDTAVEQGERKRSLRKNRTKRYDDSFSYNEDRGDDNDDDEDDGSYAAIKRKIEQKRQEAQQRSQRMAKSFENAFIEAFSKSNKIAHQTKRTRQSLPIESTNAFLINPALVEVNRSPKKFETGQYFDGDNGADSLDNDGPREHRIYKVTPSIPCDSSSSGRYDDGRSFNVASFLASEVITCSDGSDEETERQIFDPTTAPKNTDRSMHMMSKKQDLCVLCKRRAQRIVHHYVNEHRGCEVYTSRLTNTQMNRLCRNYGNLAQTTPYKNGQNQYEATCIFCQKRSRFMLSYWHQHFTMHTGEYAYRCSGCGIRKPTRSLLHAHLNTPCRKGGSVRQDFVFDPKATQIDARVCGLCNYIQLHRSNMVQHLRSQHGVSDILPKHIQSVVLLKVSPTAAESSKGTKTANDAELDSGSSCSNYGTNVDFETPLYFNYNESESLAEINYDDGDPTDDLSFMICGMLDVQVHTE